MKVDWEKAKQIAVKRLENVIAACYRYDEGAIRDYMESGLAWSSKEYMLEDDEPEPDKCYKYLDDNDCFITDNGFVCKMIQATAPDGYEYYLPYLAIKQDDKIVWTIVPYKVKSVPGNGKGTAILYTDELIDAIVTATTNTYPAIYDEVKANAMV